MRKLYIPTSVGKPDIYRDGWIDFNKNGVLDPYEDPNRPVDERVEDLLSRMTLEEKLEQLRSSFKPEMVGNISIILRNLPPREAVQLANEIQAKLIEGTRLGIPAIIHDECLHGCMAKYSTQFPQAIALAATWDPDLVYRVAKAIAKETRARGIHQCLAPVVNLARDVRAGRTEETYGEDPYLASVMGAAYCKALREEGVIATPKHFVANFEADGGRDSYEAHFSERILREVFLPPFRACIKAGALSVMAAYNSLDGVPCSSNRWLLTEVLRKEWGFNGFVVSDYGSVSGILWRHWVVGSKAEAAKLALEAGLDVELPATDFYGDALEWAVKQGLIPMEAVDEAVRRVLRAKFLVGLFDNPFVDPDVAERVIGCEEHRQLALEAARKSIVLLKNEGVLPLDKGKVKRLLVVGGAAKTLKLGGYSGEPKGIVTPLDAIAEKLKGTGAELVYVEAIPVGMDCACAILPWVPGVPLGYVAPPAGFAGLGPRIEVFDNPNLEGKPVTDFVGLYWGGFRYEWGYGKPHHAVKTENYSVRFSGRLLPPKPGRYAICLGVAGGRAKLAVGGKAMVEVDATGVSTYRRVELELSGEIDFVLEYSRTRGYAAVRLGWELVDSEEFRRALEEAKTADAVVFFADIAEGEERDRAILRLPGTQERLIERLIEVNRNVVVVLITGSPVVGEWLYKVAAVVQAWYPGQEGGRAIADVLFGDYNPGGKLPFTWPHCEGQLPFYYNAKPSGRVYDYVNMTGAPLFPFGHGLSYTRFEYSDLKIQVLDEGRLVKVSATVRNIGEREGDEVVQLYVRDAVASVARPLKELKGFKRVRLKPGEAATVEFTLTPDDLAFFDQRMRRAVEPGTFIVMVGSSSEDIRLHGEFELKKRFEAKFELEGVSASRSGDQLVIKAYVRNTGEVTDVVRVELRVDSALLDAYPMDLSPSERRSAIFRLRYEEVKGRALRVVVDGQATSLEVS